jgi:hypothetical protein
MRVLDAVRPATCDCCGEPLRGWEGHWCWACDAYHFFCGDGNDDLCEERWSRQWDFLQPFGLKPPAREE